MARTHRTYVRGPQSLMMVNACSTTSWPVISPLIAALLSASVHLRQRPPPRDRSGGDRSPLHDERHVHVPVSGTAEVIADGGDPPGDLGREGHLRRLSRLDLGVDPERFH